MGKVAIVTALATVVVLAVLAPRSTRRAESEEVGPSVTTPATEVGGPASGGFPLRSEPATASGTDDGDQPEDLAGSEDVPIL